MSLVEGIFELHLEVRDLERSMKFYGETLGFKLGRYEECRKRAFYLIQGEQLSMFSIKERKEPNLRHFAYRIKTEDIDHMIPYLEDLDIEIIPGWTGAKTDEPLVFPWLPSASVFFNDPDGNRIEFLAVLSDEPLQTERTFMYLSEWRARHVC